MNTSILLLLELGVVFWHAVTALSLNPTLHLPSLPFNSSVGTRTRGIHCFRQVAHHPAPVQDDCVKAVDLILDSPDVMTSKTWTASGAFGSAGEWEVGTCKVEIGVWTSSAQTNPINEDTFSAFSFVGKAQTIILECVVEGRRAGGRSHIGPKQLFQVIVRHTGRQIFG